MLFLLITILMGAFTCNLKAQENPAALDPADIFFQAWLEIKRAEKHQEKDEFNEAWQKYRQAYNYYEVLRNFHKGWKPNLVTSRIESTEKSMNNIEPQATAELIDKRKKTEDFIEKPMPNKGSSKGDGTGYTSQAPFPSNSIDARNQSANIQLKKLEQENVELQQKLDASAKEIESFKSQNAQLKLSPADRKRLEDLIKEKDKKMAMLRDVLARAPLQQDMNRISRENETLEQELKITARALQSSQKKLTEAKQAAEVYRDQTKIAEQRTADIEKSMAQQGATNNQVIAGLRNDLKAITATLEKTRADLGSANNRIHEMQMSLDESQTTIKELTIQRDKLRIERDTLANTLKKSDSKGIQGLISENMRLGTQLKESLDRLTYLEKNHNTTKDELVSARNDLALAKTKIINYQREQVLQNKTIKSLETQLKDAQSALSSAKLENGQYANEDEIITLRDTVKRLLAAQERRRMGEQILWDTYQKSKIHIEGLSEAINDVRKITINLSEEEKKYVAAHRRPDGEFTNPERVTKAHAQSHANALQSETSYVEGLIIRHIEKGRTQAAHSVLIDINERAPGNYSILCKLGVVEMKLGRYSKAVDCMDEAITMRENSGYAHFMMGIAQYKNKDLQKAENAFEKSLIINPDNAKAHLYLGNMAGADKRYKEAEDHFLSTIKLNPSIADAYYNLSVLYLQQKRREEAQSYYQQALSNGAQPDLAMEKRLKS
ncbi:MAG: tetratricopeptide repeat protein [Akkermansiaceae bacterium]|nr:tetratricopeptide repeat protein [Akkermansiaceae bacterium]